MTNVTNVSRMRGAALPLRRRGCRSPASPLPGRGARRGCEPSLPLPACRPPAFPACVCVFARAGQARAHGPPPRTPPTCSCFCAVATLSFCSCLFSWAAMMRFSRSCGVSPLGGAAAAAAAPAVGLCTTAAGTHPRAPPSRCAGVQYMDAVRGDADPGVGGGLHEGVRGSWQGRRAGAAAARVALGRCT